MSKIYIKLNGIVLKVKISIIISFTNQPPLREGTMIIDEPGDIL
jgi:hypothetical protein